MRLFRFIFPALLFIVFGAAGADAKARRPPLPFDPITAVTEGRMVRGVCLVQVENAPCLSLRDLQRLVGGRLAWQRLSREVTLAREGREVVFTLDESTAIVDGRSVALGSPLRWWTGQAYIPLTFILGSPFQDFAQATIVWEPTHKVLAVVPIPDISSPRFTSGPGRTNVVFNVSPRVEGRVIREGEGFMVLRLFGGRAGSRERLDVQDSLITSVDVMPRERSTDVVMNFGPSAGRPVVTMEENPRRLRVDVRRNDRSATDNVATAVEHDLPAVERDLPVLMPVVAVPATPVATPGPSSAERKQPHTPAEAALLALSPVRVIVIDPGHGGRDVGAVGRRGTLEKDVNLTIGKQLSRALQSERRYEVHLTRDTDEYISLPDRADFANKINADLFISLHCNAALNSDSNGFEIYFLSEKATDDTAAAVARRENASLELEGPAGKAKAEVKQLFWSLAKTEDLNESSEMAALVNVHARKNVAVLDRGVKQAGFYVLKWVRMPAVLVEAAFLTNTKEEKLLRSPRYIDNLVSSIVQGIQDYEKRKVQTRLGDKPPSGGT